MRTSGLERWSGAGRKVCVEPIPPIVVRVVACQLPNHMTFAHARLGYQDLYI
jgi:hypothetical protein